MGNSLVDSYEQVYSQIPAALYEVRLQAGGALRSTPVTLCVTGDCERAARTTVLGLAGATTGVFLTERGP